MILAQGSTLTPADLGFTEGALRHAAGAASGSNPCRSPRKRPAQRRGLARPARGPVPSGRAGPRWSASLSPRSDAGWRTTWCSRQTAWEASPAAPRALLGMPVTTSPPAARVVTGAGGRRLGAADGLLAGRARGGSADVLRTGGPGERNLLKEVLQVLHEEVGDEGAWRPARGRGADGRDASDLPPPARRLAAWTARRPSSARGPTAAAVLAAGSIALARALRCAPGPRARPRPERSSSSSRCGSMRAERDQVARRGRARCSEADPRVAQALRGVESRVGQAQHVFPAVQPGLGAYERVAGRSPRSR